METTETDLLKTILENIHDPVMRDAHAWVEYNRIVINDSAELRDQYLVLHAAPLPTQAGL